MALKLFRSTGYSSILFAGETRLATHPGWVILAISLWTGVVCNVALWRSLWSGDPALARAAATGIFVTAACGTVLSFLGWRKTLKPAATIVLFIAALAAGTAWMQGVPADARLLERPLSGLLPPDWASMLHWQVAAMWAGLALVPAIWVWNTHIRRLPGPQQLASNMVGLLVGGVVLAASGFVLLKVL